MAGLKKSNGYAAALAAGLYESCPKAVLAAVVVSLVTSGGSYLENASKELLREWWILFENGIVLQKPPTRFEHPPACDD